MASYAQKAPGVYVEQVPSGSAPIAGAGTSTAAFVGVFNRDVMCPNPDYDPNVKDASDPRSKKVISFQVPEINEVSLVTSFTEFTDTFGSFSKHAANPGHSVLVHAVHGFFANGGSRCYITRASPDGSATAWTDISIAGALKRLEAIDEITIVAAPGLTSAERHGELRDHCERMGTRVAVLDGPEHHEVDGKKISLPALVAALKTPQPDGLLPQSSDLTALYFPWIQVHDPTSEESDAKKRRRLIPPSGHVAGIYARVDGRRGVHKAPANEAIFGALDVAYALSDAHQDALNPAGVNCIRWMNGSVKVWGARTLGGESAGEFRYLNVRRVFNYLRTSIEQGTQWAVFEPNNPDLWAKITRNITAFLTTVWSSGALVGATPEQAFYVKCDTETNPPSTRDIGMVVTEIGVAITRPAEFVVFRLGQKAEA